MQRVKLHLAPPALGLDPHQLAPLPPGMSARDVIAAYLGALKEAIFAKVDRAGILCPAPDIRWCLTVPAIWSPESRDTMIQAAQLAGMVAGPLCPPAATPSNHAIELVPEPEAASLYCLLQMRESQGDAMDLCVPPCCQP